MSANPGRRIRQLVRCLALVAVCFAAAALRAADQKFNVQMVPGADAEIDLTVPGGRAPLGGFLPVKVRIANRGTGERAWQIELGNARYSVGGNADRQMHSVHSFTVPAASTREFFIYAPMPATGSNRGGGLMVVGEAKGPEVERGVISFSLSRGWNTPQNAPVAIEPALEEGFRNLLAGSQTAKPPAARRGSARPGRPLVPGDMMDRVSIIDPAVWPADWRLWSSFAHVMIELQSWERLDTPRRRALLDWVALGGRLVLVPAKAGGEDRATALAAGAITTVARPLKDLSPAELRSLYLSDFSPLSDPAGHLADKAFWELSPRDWQLKGRTGWLAGFIVVFGLLIGPVNLFFFAPTGKRHRLFATVPLISLVASVVLFVVITVSDGFGGAGTRRTVVVLLPEQNQAAIFQKQISRTGLLGGRTFALPADISCDREGDGAAGSSAGPQLWREGDTASGDWFTSRSTQQHTLRRLLPTRERVELIGAAGAAPVVQSTVTTTLRDFIFMAENDAIWTAAEVPPGARVTLTREPRGIVVTELPTVRFTPFLGRGSFHALGGRSESAPIATLPSIRWRDDAVLYTGRLSAAPASPP